MSFSFFFSAPFLFSNILVCSHLNAFISQLLSRLTKINTVDPVFDFPYIIQLEMILHVLSSVYKDNLSLLIYILATGIERYHKKRHGLSISTSIFCSLFSNIYNTIELYYGSESKELLKY
ncbi:hypothetical protein PHYBLDRAFT_62956 [Phycomyces blakesleeanus NRRL 1555(-)]|uniref:Uncharacterized protein n=1 Tax=Phycomyces blakesleeanus (strain ATCC 8743b / DSM 1359 / FGSC 10004 / NBRC 33097 / NRRL 1555) TaxID=763407 RepID=A0A167NXU2_PHYB8|nr:hypothetical protein PHYBLDRAFT_62956 [Phycomyces blakesleeanus NRRL 1555(-)]OAD76848.1 hypothetical protein PHYBLDRAFT_62956 [Phycomyces blakesleeanus NRRL 1555(-)]|eukprot:XP_018294888.1 hypothetical protein PHYBLDRAFT_62956 [Phycomyces blakesleeanus NRRL 1555(-)]